MPEKWTGDLIGKMHVSEITYEDLAAEMGVGKSYISMILNGSRKPADAKERLNAAYLAAVARKKERNKEAPPNA